MDTGKYVPYKIPQLFPYQSNRRIHNGASKITKQSMKMNNNMYKIIKYLIQLSRS